MDISVFTIEKGVPLPSASNVSRTLEQMDVGDSVVDNRNIKSPIGTWAAAAARLKFKVASHKQPDGTTRIWRIA